MMNNQPCRSTTTQQTSKHKAQGFSLCFLTWLAVSSLVISSCSPGADTNLENIITPLAPTMVPAPTSERPEFKPGELVDYFAQSGDTLPALANRFNTTVEEILEANPVIPDDATTMPPGFPMKIPIYFLPLWGTTFQSIPDHAFVNGVAQVGVSSSVLVSSTNGWLKNYKVYGGDKWRTGHEMVDYIAQNYSISPRLLMTVLEYQAGALSDPETPINKYVLGFRRRYYETPYLQLIIAAGILNNGYYGWRAGELTEFELPDGSIVRPDPWQNAGSVAVQYYFSRLYSGDQFYAAIGPDGFAAVYKKFFGDPWAEPVITLPGSLKQPELRFPFPAGHVWTYTGGPHTGWGAGEPFAAVDFAPPTEFSGCFAVEEDEYSIAMADGYVVRSDLDGVVIDLDMDGDERTGWVLFYLHLATNGRVPAGITVKAGDVVGYPSCEGGQVTGTHVHIARKYNGEWILADGPLAFNFEGWIAHNGPVAYKGTLTRGAAIVVASEVSDAYSVIRSDER
jgi:murein DD-endopeptidase MepM/ murein hydrolase activator NlpD